MHAYVDVFLLYFILQYINCNVLTGRSENYFIDPSVIDPIAFFSTTSRQLPRAFVTRKFACGRNVYKVLPAIPILLSPSLSRSSPARNQRAIIRSVARQSFKLVGRPPTRGCPRRQRLRRCRGGERGRERKRIPRAIMTCMVTFNGGDAPVAR